MKPNIEVRGAREHNLKNISVDIPKNKFVVITGLSGSGKSSLAFDVVYAEGERRYLESISTYARQFLGKMSKPDVDSIDGLSPSISLEQDAGRYNPRSIVATVTEIYDYMRLLFARIGIPTCYVCGRELRSSSIDEIVSEVMKFENDTKLTILSPLATYRKGTFKHSIEDLYKRGFSRFIVNGEFIDVEEAGFPELDKNKKHNISVLIDRVKISQNARPRIADSVDIAINLSNGSVVFWVENNGEKKELFFSDKYICPEHLASYGKIEPNLFSFNSPVGACPECSGLGEKYEFDVNLIIPDRNLSIKDGAIKTIGKHQFIYWDELEALSKRYNFSLYTPIKDLPEEILNIILYGSQDEYRVIHHSRTSYWEYTNRWEGIVPALERRYKNADSEEAREWFQQFMSSRVCPSCGGNRLNKIALSVKVFGIDIISLVKKTAFEIYSFLKENENSLSTKDKLIARPILAEIYKRLQFLIDTGLDYMTLDRKVSTLSGGELQRIRLATQLGSGLSGIIYVVDEPTVGLHQRDTEKLIATLKGLRDLGNTVIVVEHDEDVIRNADYIIDLGPGAGTEGGYVVEAGTLDQVISSEKSLTAQYLSGKKSIPVPKNRRKPKDFIYLKGLTKHNLKNIDVRIPYGCLVCVTGVSGSGKSTLVIDTLYPVLHNKIYGTNYPVDGIETVENWEMLDRIISVDQTPIGRTPRSNPATYVGVFDEIRKLFSMTKDARAKGFTPSRFSFNIKGGRCEACQGQGVIKVEMSFLPDVYLVCDVCGGKRYNSETLEVRYKGKNIYEVLEMTIKEAYEFFENVPSLVRKLKTFLDVGLGYMKLGQPATTLSGGEAQRVKIVSELSKKDTGNTLYILDEPTVGLHFEDVRNLINSIQKLVDKGNTVVVIEHNLDFIKCADYIIDLGPEGGSRGGFIVAEGTPEEVAENPNSYTGMYLKKSFL